jgi:hypothetical protein
MSNTPRNGDFAALFEANGKSANVSNQTPAEPNIPELHNINDILNNDKEPTAEFLEEMNALENAPPLSDEEFEKQALAHPGADGDSKTPE